MGCYNAGDYKRGWFDDAGHPLSCAQPRPPLSSMSQQVLDVLRIVENQIVGMVEADAIAISQVAAAQVARDMGVDTRGFFWPLFEAASRIRVANLVKQANERREADRGLHG